MTQPLKTEVHGRHSNHTTFRRWAEVVFETLEQLGVEGKSPFEKAGIGEDFWRDPSARIPVKKMQKVWKGAVEQTHESAFGLYVAENLSPYDFQSLGMLLLSSASVADMLEKLYQYRSFINDIGDGDIITQNDTTIISLEFSPHQVALIAEESLDAFLAFLMKLCRMVSSKDFAPLQMSLTRQKPENHLLYEQYFHCPIKYGQKRVEIHLRTPDLVASNKNHNPQLAALLEGELQDYIEKHRKLSLEDQVILVFRSRLEPKLPSESGVAQVLNMSTRSLQLKLGQAGTSYREIRQAFLMEESVRLLRDEGQSVTYVALELGYSDVSNYIRSFRKWFGCTPSRYPVWH